MAGKAINARNSHDLKLHEATSRGLCQLTFLLLGALPVVLCLAWVAVDAWPGYRASRVARCEQWLQDRLGVNVQIGQLDWKTPQRYVLSQVRLHHPETRQRIAFIEQATIEQIRDQTIIHLEQPRLEAAHLTLAWRTLHDWLLCRPELLSKVTVLQADGLSIEGLPTETLELQNVAAKFFPKDDRRLLSIRFGLPPQLSGAVPSRLKSLATKGTEVELPNPLSVPVELSVGRQVSSEALVTNIHLRTGRTALPCSLLSAFASPLERLGVNAKFQGFLNVELRQDHWALTIDKPKDLDAAQDLDAAKDGGKQGREAHRQSTSNALASHVWGTFTEVDFQQLTSGTSAAMRGEGSISLRQLNITEQGLLLAWGDVELRGGGTIGCGFLNSVASSLGLQLGVAKQQVSFAELYDFDSVDFQFCMLDNRLHWFGQGPHGAVVTSRGVPLAVRPVDYWNEPQPLTNLVQVLDQATQPLVVAASAQRSDAASGLPTSRLSRAAMWWLPIGAPPAPRDQSEGAFGNRRPSQLRPSRTANSQDDGINH